MTPKPSLRLACWMSHKKAQKFDWQEFESVCANHGYELFNVNLERFLDEQGPIHVFLHKLTDIIASAKEGNEQNSQKIQMIEDFLQCNPSIVVIDPICNVRQLLDRHICYQIIRSTDLYNYGIFTPNFCELNYKEISDIKRDLQSSNVTYPFICKPILGHGSKEAHEMTIIFNEKQLNQIKIPCVAQSFINHNAVLYKLFIVGSKYHCVERPSIKNFHTTELNVINFQSSDVSKAGCHHDLSILDPVDRNVVKIEPDHKILGEIAKTIRKEFGMDLLGVDVVISNRTSRYAIIDVNAFPGYDGFPNFFEELLECVKEKCTMNQFNGKAEEKTDIFV
ncbi:inositol-tetrakisphosphate 1-kinase-like [Coccinella septempunctata]|uniref:inositol-tetrakisphosphate 1-kinase-like n=1 Tax=Coccinella septempunctata TaxID=41139 RepID=UPI001D06094F|nr:inositol-tetrakisphosphate 1-kinase-like [Coccinella septempunctata]